MHRRLFCVHAKYINEPRERCLNVAIVSMVDTFVAQINYLERVFHHYN